VAVSPQSRIPVALRAISPGPLALGLIALVLLASSPLAFAAADPEESPWSGLDGALLPVGGTAPPGDQAAGPVRRPGAPSIRDRDPAPEIPPPEPDPANASSPSERYSRGFRLDPHEFTFTQRYVWTRMFHPTDRDRLVGAGLLIGAAALATEKRNLQAEVGESDTPERRSFFSGVQTLGDQGVVPGLALLFYLGGSTFGNYRAKETGYMLAQSALITAILTGVGQWALNEERPRDGGDLHPFQGTGHGISGHAATSASIAGILSRMYLARDADDGRVARTFKTIGKGLAYGLPILVGLSRVNEQDHFAYNSLLGVGLGFWVSNRVADAHEEYLQDRAPSRWRPTAVTPIVGERGAAGVAARWEF
jgi:membrane-associated phospholipid phosphatase